MLEVLYLRSMSGDHAFQPYDASHRAFCLGVFDANCPEFFAPNERADYAAFLDRIGERYTLCLAGGRVVGAFGVSPGAAAHEAHLNWIMVDPESQGAGVGRAILQETRRRALESGGTLVRIAASHRSAPFFARFGARQVAYAENGWGLQMHRVDMEWLLG
jgi:GNAT superfamily N-acetyltransferase